MIYCHLVLRLRRGLFYLHLLLGFKTSHIGAYLSNAKDSNAKDRSACVTYTSIRASNGARALSISVLVSDLL